MALKTEYREQCYYCNKVICKGTNAGVAVSMYNCICPKPEGPSSPPRTVTWHSATLVSADGKIKWLDNTIFLALRPDVWHDRDVIEKGKYYWLDETWGIGGKACDSYDEASAAQNKYAEQL